MSHIARMWACWLAAVLLVGCASAPGGVGAVAGKESDWVTESDEPELRKRARIRTELATGYFEQGKTTIALDEIKQALATDPSYGPAHNLRGLAYMRLGELGLARESFQRAVTLNPRDADAAHNLGWLHCQLKEYNEANTQFQRALGVQGYSQPAKTHLARGVCAARAGNVAVAEASLTKAFELDPANPVVTYNLALVLFGKGDLSRAQFHLHRLNGSVHANAESLWLGIRVENRMGNNIGVRGLSEQLRLKYPKSTERQKLDRGAFDE